MRYRSFADCSLPKATDTGLVYSYLNRCQLTLPANHIALLLNCQNLATLEDHAQSLSEQWNVPGPVIHEQLLLLAQKGLLVSNQQLIDLCMSVAESSHPHLITSIAIPTRNRPLHLERCLQSFAECVQHFGRDVSFLVMDQSDTTGVQEHNLEISRKAKKQLGLNITYIGLNDFVQLRDRLAESSGADPETIDFALLNPENCSNTVGAARNALLLNSAGTAFLFTDDDTICRLSPGPQFSAGIKLTSRYDPTESWFPSAETFDGDTFSSLDILALHEQLLGKSIGTCLAENETENRSSFAARQYDLDETANTFFSRLKQPGSRVLITSPGMAGDSLVGTSPFYLDLNADSRRRLLQWQGSDLYEISHHQLMRGVRAATISEGPLVMGFNMAIDNREILPPFNPVQRNSDCIFGTLLRLCRPDSRFGYLPWFLRHHAPAQRRQSHPTMWQQAALLSSGHIVEALVARLECTGWSANPEKRMRDAGALLTAYASMPPQQFEEWVKLQLWARASDYLRDLEDALNPNNEIPQSWRNNLHARASSLRQSLLDDSHVLPYDLQTISPQANELLQRLVLRLGKLLLIWPDLRQSGLELKESGWELGSKL